MKKKTKEWLKKKLYPIMQKASLGQLPEEIVEKFWRFYIKTMEILFNIITGITFTLAFAWFFPIYLNRGYELSIVILLCILILQLRLSKIKIDMEEE